MWILVGHPHFRGWLYTQQSGETERESKTEGSGQEGRQRGRVRQRGVGRRGDRGRMENTLKVYGSGKSGGGMEEDQYNYF